VARGELNRVNEPVGRGTWPLDPRLYRLRVRAWLPSSKGGLREGVRLALAMAGQCGHNREQQKDLRIALHEALANAIVHGHGRDARQMVRFRCYADDKIGLLVLVRDRGRGFDPASVPDPRSPERLHLSHGRGLLLMRHLVDHLEYRKQGREAVLFKKARGAR
jgi:serine/threonine-protein kinase RsbW